MSEKIENQIPGSINKSETKETQEIISIEQLEKLADNLEAPRKKVLLVDGNGITYGKDTQYRFEGSGITPFGLARMAGYLDKYGVQTTIIRLVDFNTPQKTIELQKIISEHEIIGVSTLSTDIDTTFKFCRSVKETDPSKIIIGGAEHLALDDSWTLKHKDISGIDATCRGEGEIPLLALSLGVPKEQIGALNFEQNEGDIVHNKSYGRLNEKEGISKLMHPESAKQLPKEWLRMIFPEMKNSFKYCGNTQTGSGCPFDCDFCTNGPFLGASYQPLLETAKKEIKSQYEQGIDFVFFRDAILNANPKHFDGVINLMTSFNTKHDKPIGWFAFLAAIKGEQHKRFKELADAGCVMIGVGVEDVVGDRKSLGKGADSTVAIDFIDQAKEHMLVRSLLIMGLPQHYNFSREEIKGGILNFMKEHPQAIFRINQWTPLVGTHDFDKYGDILLVDPHKDPKAFRQFDTMHNVVDPEGMYDKMDVSKDKRWVKDPNDWAKLRNEILSEYLNSQEYKKFVKTLKGKITLGREDLLYNIANDFREDILQKASSK